MDTSTTITPTESTPFSSSLTLGFDNVTIYREKQIKIHNAAGIIHGARITAIINCNNNNNNSQNDSFLLNALAGQEECATGTIMMNGIPVDAPAYLHRTVLIDDEFTSLEELTVKESMEYAASMRVATCAFTVKEIMQELLLEDVAEMKVRDCKLYVRRRVSLGKELLLNPSILCCDRLLEGLRTHEAQEFMNLLKKIAAPRTAISSTTLINSASSTRSTIEPGITIDNNININNNNYYYYSRQERIVLFSMSQPRWAILKFVDDVILLEGEKCVFCGTLQELLTTIRADPSSGTVENAISSLYRFSANSDTSLAMNFIRSGNADRVRQNVAQFFHKCASGREVLDGLTYSSPGAHVRLYYMFKYSLLQVRHNLVMGTFLFIFLAILATVLAAVYNSQEGQSGMQNRVGIIFFLVSSTLLYSILSLDAQQKEYNSFLRHRTHGYYGVFTYLTFAVLYCALERVFSISAITLVVFCFSNIVEKWDYYIPIMELMVIIGVMSFCSHFVVFFFCTVIWTRRYAMFALFALYTLNLLLAGIILNITTLPKPFQIISNLSIIRLAYESSILSQFLGRDFGCLEEKENMCYTGQQYATFLGFKSSRQWINVGILAGISGLLIIGCLVAMLWHRPPRTRRGGGVVRIDIK